MTTARQQLEHDLDAAALRLQTATTPRQRRQAWDTLRALKARQATDTDYVRQLELQRGLAL